MPDICLGSAQFGMKYGITNEKGQVDKTDVGEILIRANRAGICWLDTAQAYGNAESVLGEQMPEINNFKIISKLPAQKQSEFKKHHIELWDQAFYKSCQDLKVDSLHALLLHAPEDLRKQGGTLLEYWLLNLRERGLVERIGISIYSARDLDGINPDLLDLVQLPLSLYDQRLIQDGTIARLNDRGTAIHARSIYLQGLLLTPSSKWPSWISKEARKHQQALEALAEKKGCRLIDLALGFAKAQKLLEAVVFGICSLDEFFALEYEWESISPWGEYEWSTWGVDNRAIIDPRLWPN